MAKYDQDAPHDFREALETGQVGRWLKNWIIMGAVVAVLLGVGYAWLHVFPGHPTRTQAAAGAAAVKP